MKARRGAVKIDVFKHIIPRKYFDQMNNISPKGKDIQKRVQTTPAMVDLNERFRIMDRFRDYAQVICLANPPLEVFGPPPISTDMAKLANASLTELVRQNP